MTHFWTIVFFGCHYIWASSTSTAGEIQKTSSAFPDSSNFAITEMKNHHSTSDKELSNNLPPPSLDNTLSSLPPNFIWTRVPINITTEARPSSRNDRSRSANLSSKGRQRNRKRHRRPSFLVSNGEKWLMVQSDLLQGLSKSSSKLLGESPTDTTEFPTDHGRKKNHRKELKAKERPLLNANGESTVKTTSGEQSLFNADENVNRGAQNYGELGVTPLNANEVSRVQSGERGGGGRREEGGGGGRREGNEGGGGEQILFKANGEPLLPEESYLVSPPQNWPPPEDSKLYSSPPKSNGADGSSSGVSGTSGVVGGVDEGLQIGPAGAAGSIGSSNYSLTSSDRSLLSSDQFSHRFSTPQSSSSIPNVSSPSSTAFSLPTSELPDENSSQYQKILFPLGPVHDLPSVTSQGLNPADLYYPVYGTLYVNSKTDPKQTTRIHFIQTVPGGSYSKFDL